MARLIYALNQSLDGYVDHLAMAPDAALFRHFIDYVSSLTATVYGRRMYEVMRYWDEDQPDWDDARRDHAAAWRQLPEYVVSRTLPSVGPNATLVSDEGEAMIRRLKRLVVMPALCRHPPILLIRTNRCSRHGGCRNKSGMTIQGAWSRALAQLYLAAAIA